MRAPNRAGHSSLTSADQGAFLRPLRYEAHIPAAQHPPGTYSRLSRPHVDTRWPSGASESPAQGPQALGADDLQEVVVALGFGRDRRLRNHGEFVRAQRQGRRVGTAHFTLLVAAQPPQPGGLPDTGTRCRTSRAPRLGLVVARRIGNAVRRNRVKRLCRQCFREWPDLLPPGVDLIVIAREGAHELGLADVRAEWLSVELRLKNRAAEALARPADPYHPHRDRT